MPSEDQGEQFLLKTKIYLINPDGIEFMGIGVLWLLQHIETFGSIRKAAAHMHLSYAKAHRMIREAEQYSGLKLVERRRGGDLREGTFLSPTGKRFMSAYQLFQEEVKENAERSFREFRRKLGGLYS